jgi:hypothetical protein
MRAWFRSGKLDRAINTQLGTIAPPAGAMAFRATAAVQ